MNWSCRVPVCRAQHGVVQVETIVDVEFTGGTGGRGHVTGRQRSARGRLGDVNGNARPHDSSDKMGELGDAQVLLGADIVGSARLLSLIHISEPTRLGMIS